MSPRRLLLTQARRGVALATYFLITAVGLALSVSMVGEWSGRWLALGHQMRYLVLILGPIAVTMSAWQAGRDRRRRTDELLRSVSRPLWQHKIMSWASAAGGAMAGYLTVLAVTAASIAFVPAYITWSWWLPAWVGMTALVALSAVGFAIGSVLPGWIVPPIAGLATYVLQAIPSYINAAWVQLTPFGVNPPSAYRTLEALPALGATVWFVSLAVAVLALGASQRSRRAVVTAGVAITTAAAVAVPLSAAPRADSWAATSWQTYDRAATAPVCTPPQELEVCVTTVNADLLPEATEVLRPVLQVTARIPGAPTRAVELVDGTPPAGVIKFDLTWHRDPFSTELTGEEEIVRQAMSVAPACSRDQLDLGDSVPAAAVPEAAAGLLARRLPVGTHAGGAGSESSLRWLLEDPGLGVPILDDLLQADEDRVARWLSAYYIAAAQCDIPALRALATEEPAP